MEPIQKQILTLSHKLDALYQIVEQLDNKVAQALSERCLQRKQEVRESFLENSEAVHYQLKGHINLNPELEHKDVLVDSIFSDPSLQAGDRSLTPEIQIQRLTAQLTAAYNRIAALEEQLLFKRIH